MTYQQITQDIKDLKIQGAERIAIAAVEAFGLKLQETQDETQLKEAAEELKNLRSTEPGLRNAIEFCLQNYRNNPDVANTAINHFKTSKEKIAAMIAEKIETGMNIYTHCHSSTVEGGIKLAWEQGKRFTVYSTETRPKFQGRITAESLAKAGIPVIQTVDSAAFVCLKQANLFLFGADAIASDGRIYNKIGSGWIARLAHDLNVPAFSCTNSWKFAPETLKGVEEKIEQRSPDEVWENPPANVTILNPAFEIVQPDHVTGVICELGVIKPENLLNQVETHYPWLVK